MISKIQTLRQKARLTKLRNKHEVISRIWGQIAEDAMCLSEWHEAKAASINQWMHGRCTCEGNEARSVTGRWICPVHGYRVR